MLAERGWCVAHQRDPQMEKRAQDRAYDLYRRDPEMAAFYKSAEWEGARLRKLAQDPVCQTCNRAQATTVHHKVPAKLLSPTARLDPDNLDSACTSCHSRHEWRVSHRIESYQYQAIDWTAVARSSEGEK
jgi:5-methylcytosine-specific restriction endonuclease McrA